MARGILTVFNCDLCFYALVSSGFGSDLLESGRSQAMEPSRRARAISWFSLWAKRIVMGNSSGVSSVAYPNIIPYKISPTRQDNFNLIAGAEIFKRPLQVDSRSNF